MLGSARAVLRTSAVNRIFFSLKRAHQSVLRFSRQMLLNKGVTPARYDMLHALNLRRNSGIAQKQLQIILGVHKATVSRMLGSLEELGLVRRDINPFDRRCKDVWLTDEGFARLQAAYDPIVRRGWIQAALTAVLGTGGNPDLVPPRRCVEEQRQLDRHLWSFRRGFVDTASLGYPR